MTVATVTRLRGSSRWIWRWCIAYTSLTPARSRQRRREEIRSHLWESERAGLPGTAVTMAALRGAASDLVWVAMVGLPALGRSFGTPTPYVVLAPLFPIQAWVVSALYVGRTAHIGEQLGRVGGGSMLLVATIVWMVRRTFR